MEHAIANTIPRISQRGFALLAASAFLISVAAPTFAHDPDAAEDQRSLSAAASDAFLEGRLVTAYTLNTHLNPFALDVDVTEKRATIGGTVQTDAQRELAIDIARDIESIVGVDDQIIVDTEVAGASDAERDLADHIGDATTTASVKTRLLADPDTEGLAIDVDTHKNVVTLSGQVASQAEADEAVAIARATNGVDRVINQLVVTAA